MKIPTREKTIHFRATLAEKLEIQRQANKLKLRLSVYVRLCVMQDLSQRKEPA
jgi:hypothetical protein